MAAHANHARELRLRSPYAVVAGLGGIALLGAAALQAVGPQAKVSELTLELITFNKRGALEVGAAAINGVGLIALGLTLAFLARAAQARRKEMTQAPRLTAIAGGIVGAVGGIAYGVAITIKSHEFVTHGVQSYVQANSLVGGAALAALQYLGLIGALLLAVAFVLTSLNAMRVGLLTRFLGYLGMVAAAASLLLIGSAPALLVEVAWLVAIAFLLSGRQATEPEAWRRGEAVPWPSAAEMREQRQRTASGREDGRAKASGRTEAKPSGGDGEAVVTTTRTRSTTPKRKRKRRK